MQIRIVKIGDVPPGSLTFHANDERVTVRFPDGSGWWADGSGPPDRGASIGWEWDSHWTDLTHCVLLFAEGLTRDECMRYAGSTPEQACAMWLEKTTHVGPVETEGPAVGVAVFVIAGGRALLSQRLAGASDGAGALSCPGGLVGDETILEAAARELREETGLELPANAVILPGVKESRRPDGRRCVCVFVEARFDEALSESPIASREPSKHSEWQWYGPRVLLAKTDDDVWDRVALTQRLLRGES